MILCTIFFASLVMGFSGAMMPGPMLTVTIKESLRRGAKAGPQIVSGHVLLELLIVIAIFFGLGKVIMWSSVKGTIGVVGGLFLFWMAYGILREAWSLPNIDLSGKVTGNSLHPVVTGVTVSVSNPYWSLWWATAGASSLMLAANNGITGVTSFYFGHITADYIWYTIVSVAVAGGKKLFTPLVFRIILSVCGVFLLGLAGYFVYSGLFFWGLMRNSV
ncbi:MAG: LysE family transporter [Desulfitobacteriaceae bacterium]